MPSLRISDVARSAGVTPDTIRFYERRGVLPTPVRGSNGYRLYTASTVERVRLIRRAVGIGFSLDELARVLRVRDRGGVPCSEVRAMAATKLDDIARRLRELREMRRLLKALVAQWDAQLASTPAGQQARLLDLIDREASNGSRRTAGTRTPTSVARSKVPTDNADRAAWHAELGPRSRPKGAQCPSPIARRPSPIAHRPSPERSSY